LTTDDFLVDVEVLDHAALSALMAEQEVVITS